MVLICNFGDEFTEEEKDILGRNLKFWPSPLVKFEAWRTTFSRFSKEIVFAISPMGSFMDNLYNVDIRITASDLLNSTGMAKAFSYARNLRYLTLYNDKKWHPSWSHVLSKLDKISLGEVYFTDALVVAWCKKLKLMILS